MSELSVFNKVMQKHFNEMIKYDLFVTDINKDELWDLYLRSFPEGTDPLYKTNSAHNCNACRVFLRNIANMVAIVDGKIVSFWDVKVDNYYQNIADELSKFVKSKPIKDIFTSESKKIGNEFTRQVLEDKSIIKWNHMHVVGLPNKFVVKSSDLGTVLSDKRSNKDVLKRSLDGITLSSAEIVLELIDQNSIYRGEEHKGIIEKFVILKKEYDLLNTDLEKESFTWSTSIKLGGASKIKNTVIGTLLSDISDGKELDLAVRLFESKVAPSNYKRPKSLITQKMITKAQEKVLELGIEDSLNRRYAVSDDITINNVIFANRDAKKKMNIFDKLSSEVDIDAKKLEKVEEVHIDKFIEKILPNAKDVEVLVENKHETNFMSLVAPENSDAPNILKWGNNFSWAYNGELADSLKERVKKAGGKVDGVLRFSIQWNENKDDENDLDAHCIEPRGNKIYYSKKVNSKTTGNLDVDIINPNGKIAVENITWTNIDKMEEGKYTFLVNNYSNRGGKSGFRAEIEYEGKIYSYDYKKELANKENVVVAEIEFSKRDGIKFLHSLKSTTSSKEIWGVKTHRFTKVTMIMNSPNHWDGEKTGNRHCFFILEDCINEGKVRGFFNEFLKEELNEHRKVFEVLGSKMKAEYSDKQLSGVGFSSTQKNHLFCKVTGSFERIIKIIF